MAVLMSLRHRLPSPFLFVVALVAFAISLVSNALAERLTDRIDLLGTFVSLRLAHNPGIAFSIALPARLQGPLILIALLAVGVAALRENTVATTAAERRIAAIAFGLLLGGALANIVDRLPDGLVTDYVSIGTFPIFNIADTCICIGAGLIALTPLTRARAS